MAPNFRYRDERKAICHPDRKHKAHGLCYSCYQSQSRTVNSIKASCHPAKAHAAKGLCKVCYLKTYHKEYQSREHVAAKRRERSWRKHGASITVAQYDEMLKKQNGLCAICERPPQGKIRLAVDHDHDTGRIRGLLCDYCNRRLLIKKNTIQLLKRAVTYLEVNGA